MTTNLGPPKLGPKIEIRDGHIVAAVDLVPGDVLYLDENTPTVKSKRDFVPAFLRLGQETRQLYQEHPREGKNFDVIRNAVDITNGEFIWKPGTEDDEDVLDKDNLETLFDAMHRLYWPIDHPTKSLIGYSLFYPLLFLQKHSCLPSAIVVSNEELRHSQEGLAECVPTALIATLAVPAGTILTISRLPWHMSREKRRIYTENAYGLVCECERCADDGKYRAADRKLVGTVKGFSAEDDPEDAVRVKEMVADYDKLSEALFHRTEHLEDYQKILDMAVEFLNVHNFLHSGHWRRWTVLKWLFAMQIRLGQYVLSMKTIAAMITCLRSTAGVYSAREWAHISYKYKYAIYLIKLSKKAAEQNVGKNPQFATQEIFDQRIETTAHLISEFFGTCKEGLGTTLKTFQMFSLAFGTPTPDKVTVLSETTVQDETQ